MSTLEIVILSIVYFVCGFGVAALGVYEDWTPFATEMENRPGFLLMWLFWSFFLIIYGGWGLVDWITSRFPQNKK